MTSQATILVLALTISASAWGNDFPTQARVEFVLSCMEAHGGQSYDTLYPCVCAADHVAAQYSYDEYVQVELLSYLRSTPGERGGLFRDAAPDSRNRAQTYSQVLDAAERACFIAQGSASNATE